MVKHSIMVGRFAKERKNNNNKYVLRNNYASSENHKTDH